MEISIYSIIMAFIALLTLRLLVRIVIKPYLMIQDLKRVKGAMIIYRPFIGILPEYRYDEKNHGDTLYSTKQRIRSNPDMRFLAVSVFDTVMIELYDPELVKEFLNKQVAFAPKNLKFFGTLDELSRNSLVWTEGERWKNQRKLLSQVFHFDYINSFLPTINSTAKEWIDKYCDSVPSSTVNVSSRFKNYTATVVLRTFFGEKGFKNNEEADKLIQTILKIFSTLVSQTLSIWNLVFGTKFFKLGLRSIDREYMRNIEFAKKYFAEKIQHFKEKKHQQQDTVNPSNDRKNLKNLIELLLEQSEVDKRLSDFEIGAQAYTFFMAGTDTTSELLAISMYSLSTHQDIQQKIRDEIQSYVGKVDEITYDHLSKMDYLNAFIKEALRMYGPATLLFGRVAKEEAVLNDLKIPKGSIINYAIHGLCQNPKYFKNPNEFRPERWLIKEDLGVKDPLAYLPFSGGARRCIGEQLAYIESKVMICHLVRRFNIDLKRPYELKMKLGLVYMASDPVNIIFTKI